MSARRVAVDTNLEESANATYIDFPRGDGQPNTWPTNTTRMVDSEGQVNFFDPLPLSHSQSVRWRALVANAIANDLQMAEGPSYILRDFPQGYGFFDHNKGGEGDPRHDLYLYGPVKKRFRSVNEFIPHAIWLMKDPAIHTCACKYCSKNKSQREITASMSGILRSSPATASPTPNRTKALREKRTRDPIVRVKESRVREKVYAAVQKTVKPLKPSANVLKQPMLVERNNDLRAIHPKASMALRRWFREGEVVWCALPHAIMTPGAEKITIQFWPAVIEEVFLKTMAVPRKNDLDLSTTASFGHGLPLASSSAVQLDSMDEEDGRGIVLESNDDPLHYTINQWTKYKVRFLAVSHSCSIDDVDVLPYQAHMPPDELIAFMTQIPPNDLHFEKEILARFNPCPGDHPPSFYDAVSPYAMALQIASTLSSFWCLTDEFEMKYALQASRSKPPPPPALLPPTPVPVHSSLQSAIEEAGRHNAQLSNNSMMLNSTLYRNVSSTTPHMSQAELQKTSTQILGIPSQSESISQTRFQGLWWGTERIWVDDFIRLKVPRRSLAPEGAANIFPPAGPGKRQLEQCLAERRNPADFTAGTRGVFMRLDGLMAVEVPRDDGSSGTKKAARACGVLYEIVEEDWEDPKDPKSPEAPLDNSAEAASQSQHIAGPSQVGPSSSTSPALSMNAYATQQPQLDGTASSASLSSPNPDPVQSNLLPAAPVGYKLRPILEPGYEAVVELGLISGRYYPRILSHPQVVPAVQTAFSRSVEEGGVTSANNLWALEGLSGGYHNSVDPHKYKRSRVYMMQEADRESLIQLQTYKREKLEVMNDEDDPMEIDEMYA